jgi:hypothetical protein
MYTTPYIFISLLFRVYSLVYFLLSFICLPVFSVFQSFINLLPSLLSSVCCYMCFLVPGSLPPSPADSGVSDVDSSSSGHTSNDELKARLQLTPGKRSSSSDLTAVAQLRIRQLKCELNSLNSKLRTVCT